ncbi:MAG: hypothetical protein E4G89_01530 [Methanothrix sp.]|nr:MAG: hypothetical protein E4G89_01530 [Methanothrix sp.]
MTDEELGIKAPIKFSINDQRIAEVREEFKDVDAYKDLEGAKTAKKTLQKMRTTLGEAHKIAKADALEYGRRCDSEKNRLLAQIAEIEDPITNDLDIIKNAKEVAEQARKQKIMDEIERIQSYSLDRHSLTLDELLERRTNLQEQVLNKEFLEEFYADAELSRDEADMKLRIAIQNEKERLEEEEKQAAIAEENRILREKMLAMEKEQAERDRAAQKLADQRAEEARLIQKKIDDDRQAELDKQEAALAEQQKIIDAETAKREIAEAEAIAAAQAPDREKLLFFANLVDSLILAKPTLTTDRASEVLVQAIAMLIEVAYDIRRMTGEMK